VRVDLPDELISAGDIAEKISDFKTALTMRECFHITGLVDQPPEEYIMTA
jgi:hypothetical protein